MSYKRRINVRGIIVDDDGKLFSQQLTAGDDGSKRDYWCTPGGGMDDGESLHAALTREMIEETGVAPIIGDLLFIQQFHDGTKEQLEFFFHITNHQDYTAIDLASTSHGVKEIASCGFIDVTTHNILPAFLQTTNLAERIAAPQPVSVSSEM